MFSDKKIMFYIDHVGCGGGAQRVMCILANHYEKMGCKVILVNDMPTGPEFVEYKLSRNINRIFLQEENRGNKFLKNVYRVVKFRKIVRQEHPDLVVSFLGRCNLRALIGTNGLNVKKMVSVRNAPEKEYGSSKLDKLVANHLFKKADGIVFQTEDAKNYFVSKVQEKSTVIFNPVDDIFYLQESKRTSKDIITVGRRAPQKNHKMLVDAFVQVAKDIPESNLIIYGRKYFEDGLEDYVEELGYSSRILFPGNIDNVCEKMSQAGLFVLSSNFEGMPNALMEAMAVGIPVISTDCECGGPRTLITNENEGLLVPINDTNALSEAMKKVILSEKLQKKMSENERIRADSFRSEVVLKQWDSYILALLGVGCDK